MQTGFARIFLVMLFLTGSVTSAKNLKLELYTQVFPTGVSEEELKAFGGLSGMFWNGQKLVVVSDDRGKFALPRFYELDLKINASQAELRFSQTRTFRKVPQDWILDLEGLALLPDGRMILSSEGDLNRKPRSLPQVFLASSAGDYLSKLDLPDKFLPERTGLQKKGVENNRGFEALTVSESGKDLYILNEYPIISDQGDDDQSYWLRLVHFKPGSGEFKAVAEYPYQITRQPNNERGVEVFRGVSEILQVSNGQILVLERGARLSKAGLAYSGGLYLADLSEAKDVSKIPSLATPGVSGLKKSKLVDFEDIFRDQKVENFEALSWGPLLPDGRKSLLVLSDNNFSAKEKSTLLVFAVKEVE